MKVQLAEEAEAERKLEAQITQAMAETYNFSQTKSGKHFRCNWCGKRFSVYYIGAAINERMGDHYLMHYAAQADRRNGEE